MLDDLSEQELRRLYTLADFSPAEREVILADFSPADADYFTFRNVFSTDPGRRTVAPERDFQRPDQG